MWSESTRTLTYIHLNQPSNCVCIWTVEEGSMHLEESNNIDWGSLPRSSDGGIVIVENYVLFYKVRMMNNRFIFSFLFLNHHHNHHYHSTIWWWCASFIAHTHTHLHHINPNLKIYVNFRQSHYILVAVSSLFRLYPWTDIVQAYCEWTKTSDSFLFTH